MRYISLNDLSFVPREYVPININQFYIANKPRIPSVKDPQYINKELKRVCGFNVGVGGYGEDRSDVWSGTYLDKNENYIHLGVDINFKEGTCICSPCDGELIETFTDTDTKMGWGGRIIIRHKKSSPFILFAHLRPTGLTDRKRIKKGDVLGQVGTWPENGNTFEHLHLQFRNSDDFENMDGYGTKLDLINNPCPFTTKI